MVTNSINTLLFKKVSIAPLVVFRIIFGSLMLFGTIRFIANGWVNDFYIQPDFYFTYFGFSWVHPLSGNWMYFPFVLIIISSIGVISGFFYRFSSILLFISFTYIELLDKTNYLNHYYFISLVAFILCWLPANRCFSLDIKFRNKERFTEIALFNILLLQFQLGVVYFFAGIAKINSDWLFRAEPLSAWLNGFDNLPLFGNLLAQKWTAYTFSWVGCIYDLSIVFLLLNRKTRLFAYFLVVVFHLLTWLLFPIGIFPWVMIFCTLIFFSSHFHQRILNFMQKIFRSNPHKVATEKKQKNRKLVLILISIYVFIQLAAPLRCWLYPGNLFWTEEGFRFSWRVMLMQKKASATFYIVDHKTQRSMEVNNRDFITKRQEGQMGTQPDMILQYAHHLYAVFQDTLLTFGTQKFYLKNPEVKAKINVSLNGRPNQPFILPNANLAKIPYDLKHRTFLEKYKAE